MLGIFLNRRNVILMLMAIELILLAVNINLVAFSAFLGDLTGQVMAMFVLTVAAAEAAIGLAILVIFFRRRGHRGRRRRPDARLMRSCLSLIVFLPLLAAIIAGLGGRWIGKAAGESRHDRRAVHWRGAQLADLLPTSPATRSRRSCRCSTGSARATLQVDWALRVDALTAVMLVVVTTVSALVHLYSWGYMEEDPSQPRFFAYLSLFSFAMLMLVTADSLVQMFFGWEGVGLASYLLIGFWYYKPSRQCRGAQGVRRQPRRRLRLQPRHFRHLPGVRHGLDPSYPCRRAATWRGRRSASPACGSTR